MNDGPYAPYDSSYSPDYLDLLAGHLANGVGFFLRAMTTSPPVAPLTTSFRDIDIDGAIPGQMSMFQCQVDETIGVYYQSYIVPEQDLQFWCQAIVDNDLREGQGIVKKLMAPFQETPDERDAWLSSNVVSAYLGGLQSNSVQVIDSGYYQKADFLASLPSRSEWVKKLKSASQIFWPICEGNHWYLMVIEKDPRANYTVKVLDGFNNQSKHAEIAAKGLKFLQKLYKDQDKDKVFRILNPENPSYLVPMQDNADDCGTAICYYAYKRMQGKRLSTYAPYSGGQCNYQQFRLCMAQSIALNAQHQKKPAAILQTRKPPCVIDLDKDEKIKQPRRRSCKA